MMSTYDSACGDSPTASADGAKRKQSVAARIGELDREIGNLVQAIATVGISPRIADASHRCRTRTYRDRPGDCCYKCRFTETRREHSRTLQTFVVDLQVALTRDTI